MIIGNSNPREIKHKSNTKDIDRNLKSYKNKFSWKN